MPVSAFTLCLAIAALCNSCESLGQESPRRSFLARRAIDGTRGRKYFDPEEEDSFDSYGSAGGQYDPQKDSTELSDIRGNVPGEPGVDFPAYRNLPQTGFTCEGRSRGYYADEAAGCQVFHVCHDILVSSFLCPIGSVFSQKLLTCDWWNKVDCSSTQDYVETSRGSFEQADDDDMIRKAYVMMSLQPGNDGPDVLVDPDQGGTIPNFPAIGKPNTVPNTFNQYSNTGPTNSQQFSPSYDDYRNRQSKNDEDYSYQGEQNGGDGNKNVNTAGETGIQDPFYYPPVEHRTRRPPYQDSPIIRIHTIGNSQAYRPSSDRFDDPYHRADYDDGFQPSYAPTVPTVTTTTRKFYSPTVPTTYKSSTVAYNELYQQDYANSDSHFAQSQDSRSFVTEPTILRRSDNLQKDNPVSSRRHYAQIPRDSAGYRGFYNPGQAAGISRNEEIDEGPADDFEIRESIGLARAINDAPERISLQPQSIKQNGQSRKKNGRSGSWSNIMVRTNSSRYSSNIYHEGTDERDMSSATEDSSSTNYDDDSTVEYLERSTTPEFESESFASTFGLRTTPLLRNQQTTLKQNYATLEPMVATENYPGTTEKYVETTTYPAYGFYDDDFPPEIEVDKITTSRNDKWSTTSTTVADDHENLTDFKSSGQSGVVEPRDFLEPPFDGPGFRINVPDLLSRQITTLFTQFTTSTTPETVSFSVNPEEDKKQESSLDEKSGQSLIDSSQELLKGQSLFNKSLEVTTPNSILPTVHSLSREIVPPFEDFNYGSEKYSGLPKNDGPEPLDIPIEQSQSLKNKRNQTEAEILPQNEFQFTVRNPIQGHSGHLINHTALNTNLPERLISENLGISVTMQQTTSMTRLGSNKEIYDPGYQTDTSAIKNPHQPVQFEYKQENGNLKNVEESSILSGQLDTSKVEIPHQPVRFEYKQEYGNLRNVKESSVLNGPLDTSKIEIPNQPVQYEYREENGNLKTLEETSSLNSPLPFEHNSAGVTVNLSDQSFRFEGAKENSNVKIVDQTHTTNSLLRPGQSEDTRNSRQNVAYNNMESTVRNSTINNLPQSAIFENLEGNNNDNKKDKPQLDNFKITNPPEIIPLISDLSNFEVIRSVEHNLKSSNVHPSQHDLKQNSDDFDKNDSTDYSSIEKNLHESGFNGNNFDFVYPGNINIVGLMAELFKTDRVPRPFSLKDATNVDLRTRSNLGFNPSTTISPKVLLLDSTETNNFYTTRSNLGLNYPSTTTANPFPTDAVPDKFSGSSINVIRSETSESNPQSGDVNSGFENPENTSQGDSQTPKPKDVLSESPSRNFSPVLKEQILEQLTKNFGRPLYHVEEGLNFELPNEQRSTDFQTGRVIKDLDKSEDEEKVNEKTNSTETTVTPKTIVETEFVPALGFSLDDVEEREKYAETLVGGLLSQPIIDDAKNSTKESIEKDDEEGT